MKRDYTGKEVPNISNGVFYDASISNTLVMRNPTQPFGITLSATPTANYSIKLPNTQGGSGQVLINDGSGNLSWGAGGGGGGGSGVTSIGLVVPSFMTVTSTGGNPITGSGTFTISATSTGTGSVVLSNAPTLTGTATFGKLSSTGQSNEIITISGLDPNIKLTSTARAKSILIAVCDNNGGYMTGSTAGDTIFRTIGTANMHFTTTGTWPALEISNTTQNTVIYSNLLLSGQSGSGKGVITIINNTTTGNNYNFQLPATAGASGSLLTSAGGVSAMTWTATTGTGNIVRADGPTINDLDVRGSSLDIQTTDVTIATADIAVASGGVEIVCATFDVLGTAILPCAVVFNTFDGAFTATTGAGVIALSTAAGIINLTTGIGAINVVSSAGAITLDALVGGVGINVGTGGFLIDCTGGIGEIDVGGGTLSLRAAAGSINLEVGVGSISIGSAVAGNIYLSSGTGALSFTASQGGANFSLGQFTVQTTNGVTGAATGNITLATNTFGINTGPGNISISTLAAYTGTITIQSKSSLTFSSNTSLNMNSKYMGMIVDNDGDVGNVFISTTSVGANTGPGNISINTLSAYTGNISVSAKGLLTTTAASFSLLAPTSSITSTTSVTVTSPVTTLTTSSAVSTAPLEVLNPTQGTGTFTRIYFGREKSTSNCGSIAFHYNGVGSGNNYVAFGQFGSERLLVYPGTNIGTIPTAGSVLINQIRCQFLETSYHITLYDTTATVGEKIRILADQPTVNYDFILPRNPGTAGQVLVSGAGTAPMTWATVGTGSVSSVAVSAPAYLGVTGSPITTSGTITFTPTTTGTGDLVLSTSPTLVTPVLGAATATSIIASTFLAARGALAESNATAGAYMGMSGPNAKIELVAGANTNLGFIDFTTATPTVDYVGRIIYSHSANTMTFETGNTARVVLSNTNSQINTLLTVSKNQQNVLLTNGTSVDSCFIDMQTATNSRRAIIGIDGVGLANFSPGALFLGSWSNNHVILASNAIERIRILNTGEVVMQGVLRRVGSTTMYYLSTPTPIPNNTVTAVYTWSLTRSTGDALTSVGGIDFVNQLNRTISVTVSYSCYRADSGLPGYTEYWIDTSYNTLRYGYTRVTGTDWATGTATIVLNHNEYFTLQAYQNSGFGTNIGADSVMTYTIL